MKHFFKNTFLKEKMNFFLNRSSTPLSNYATAWSIGRGGGDTGSYRHRGRRSGTLPTEKEAAAVTAPGSAAQKRNIIEPF